MRLKLFAKMMLFILVPAVLGIALLAGISNNLAKESLEKQISADMLLLVDSQKNELSNVVMSLRGATDTLSEVMRIVHYLRAVNDNLPPAVIQDLLKGVDNSILSATTNFKRIQYVGIVNTKGVIVHANTSELIGNDLKDLSYFKRTMQGETCVLGIPSKNNKRVTIIVTSPVQDNGKNIGMIFTQVNMEELTDNTVASIKVGESGRCFVYTDEGIMMMHPDAHLVGADHSTRPWFKQTRERQSGIVEFSVDGVQKMGFFTHVPTTKWTIVLSVNQEELFAPIATMARISIIVVVVTMLIVGAIIFLVTRSITVCLQAGAQFTQYVAAGNLEITPAQQKVLGQAAERTDEIGELAQGVGVMVQNLIRTVEESRGKTVEAEHATAKAEEAMKQAELARTAAENAKREGMLAAAVRLEGVVEIVTSASAELSAQIEQSERGSSDQAARLTETATAMEQMNGAVIDVAKNASMAADFSAVTRTDATEGASVVSQTIASISHVQKQSLSLKEDMVALGEQAEAISHVMSVISDIADQTNLLALNAAIEAARAGEAGRGFAVVADEVRKLAEKTMHSTVDVSNAVKNIQASAAKNMQQVDEAVLTIAQANTLAEKSGAALQHIVQQADHTADQVRAIATASEEQSATSEEITRTVIHVNGIASETSRAMQESARAVSDLARQTQVLNDLIVEMKRG